MLPGRTSAPVDLERLIGGFDAPRSRWGCHLEDARLAASEHPFEPQLRKASSLDPGPYRLSFGQTFCKPQRLGHFDMTGDFRPQGFWLGARLATLDPL
jgi:hypothetical protein